MPDIGPQLPELTLDEHEARAELMRERETKVSATVFKNEPFRLYFWRRSIDVRWWKQDEASTSTARRLLGSGPIRTVTMIGPRDMWAEAESAYEQWQTGGEPELSEWTVRVTADGRTLITLPHLVED